MYEGIHIIHHSRVRYGTVEDPEYLPLALMKPWSLPLFLLIAVLMPVALLLRFGVLGPLSMLLSKLRRPKLRRIVVARFSGLQMNPSFEQRAPEGEFARQWRWQEISASLVAVAIIVSAVIGWLPLRPLLIYMSVIAGVAVLNQVRTLVAHLTTHSAIVVSCHVAAALAPAANSPAMRAAATVSARYPIDCPCKMLARFVTLYGELSVNLPLGDSPVS
jgi:uncharacterized protein involved in response to NO